MSPHHLVLIFEASAVKSRRIASARADAAGSGMVVFFHRRGRPPGQPGLAHQPATRLRNADGPGDATPRGSAARRTGPWTACARPRSAS